MVCAVRRASHLAFAALTALVLPSESHASIGPAADTQSPKVGFVPLILGEGVGERMHKALDEGLARGIDRGTGHASVLQAPAGDCDADCRDELATTAGMTHVVWGEVSKAGPDFKILLSAHEIGSGRDPIQVEGSCEICGETELAERIADLSASLEARIEDPSWRLATLVLSGSPTGATVFIDGEEVGATPFESTIEPGPHEIEVRKPGYTSQSQNWNADEGVSDRIRYTLRRSKAEGGTPPFVRPLGYALSGVGLGLVVTGAIFFSLDGKDHQTTCTDELMDADGDCPFRYATKGPGIGLLVGGIVAAGAGAGLLTWSFKADGKLKTEMSLRLSPRAVSASIRF